jgi:hypothetical protein
MLKNKLSRRTAVIATLLVATAAVAATITVSTTIQGTVYVGDAAGNCLRKSYDGPIVLTFPALGRSTRVTARDCTDGTALGLTQLYTAPNSQRTIASGVRSGVYFYMEMSPADGSLNPYNVTYSVGY